MTKIVRDIGVACKQALANHRVKIAGLIAAGVTVTAARAATFNFTILTDLADALVALIPSANDLVNQGGPLVINICIVAAICAPFIWIYHMAYGHK